MNLEKLVHQKLVCYYWIIKHQLVGLIETLEICQTQNTKKKTFGSADSAINVVLAVFF